MNDLLHNLIEALREELKQYGEMLAVLEQQQQSVVQRQTNNLLQNVNDVNAQASVIAAVRHEREQHRRNVARLLKLDENAPFAVIIPNLPQDYRPLLQALVQENNALLVRVRQRREQVVRLLGERVFGRAAGRVQPPHLTLAATRGQRVQHREHRCDADSGRDQQHRRGTVGEHEIAARCGDVEHRARP